jgi:hypothetical protein
MTASSGGGGNVRHTTFAEQHSRGNRKQGTIESQQLSLDQTRSMLTFPLHGKNTWEVLAPCNKRANQLQSATLSPDKTSRRDDQGRSGRTAKADTS